MKCNRNTTTRRIPPNVKQHLENLSAVGGMLQLNLEEFLDHAIHLSGHFRFDENILITMLGTEGLVAEILNPANPFFDQGVDRTFHLSPLLFDIDITKVRRHPTHELAILLKGRGSIRARDFTHFQFRCSCRNGIVEELGEGEQTRAGRKCRIGLRNTTS